jgi:hypothetical protein
MNKYYYADKDNKSVGPCTPADLRKLAGEGTINGLTNVILEGASTWSTWGEVQATESQAETIQAVAGKASQAGERLRSFDWGGLLMGLLLVIVEYLILPYFLLRRAAATLAEWGRNRTLPSETSELPVLTFLTVVCRPAVHVLWTLYYTVKALIFLTDGRPKAFFDIFEREAQVDFPDRVYYFIGLCAFTYFMNFLIGLLFDALSLLVNMANSLKKIEKK